MADSDDEGALVVDDGNAVDDTICPICRGSTFVGETINCEKCEYWFHFQCVGVTHNDEWVKNEDVPYFCDKCRGIKKKKPTKTSAKKSKKQASTPSPAPVVVSPPIKLKISLGKKKPSSARSIELSPPRQIPNKRKHGQVSPPKTPALTSTSNSDAEESTPKRQRKRQKSEDEEEKWLDAVESGNLHAVDAELKSIRDPKLMTARQRAMVDRKNVDFYNDEESGHMSLSYITSKKSKSEKDEEENQRIKALKSAKRKEIEQEKREQDRIKTVERLLNKKESTLKNAAAFACMETKPNPALNVPKIIYIQRKEGITLSFPLGMEVPIVAQKGVKPRPPTKCSVKNCKNIKKYNCSKTGRPLCSLQCYKKNLLMV